MSIFYLSSPRMFYDEDIHGYRKVTIPDATWVAGADEAAVPPMVLVDNPGCKIPADAMLITREWHQALLDGESSGKLIREDDKGYPLLVDPPPATLEQLADQERVWRDGELLATDQMVTRHRDELEEGSETTLSPTQYIELQSYRRALRNWPEAGEFPLIDHRPPAPLWLADQLE